jgi:hypothetical protein
MVRAQHAHTVEDGQVRRSRALYLDATAVAMAPDVAILQ